MTILDARDAVIARVEQATAVPVVRRSDTLDDAGSPVDIRPPFIVFDFPQPDIESDRLCGRMNRRAVVFQVTYVHSLDDAALDLAELGDAALAGWTPRAEGLRMFPVVGYAQSTFARADRTLPGRIMWVTHSMWRMEYEPL